MSAVTSRLSEDQEKQLLSLFGQARICLLYKASVHDYTAVDFHARCDRQGPTITVAYNQSGFIFGAYVSKDYTKTTQDINDDKAFLFSIHNEREKPVRVSSTNGLYGFTNGDTGPNYGALVFLYDNAAKAQSQPGTQYNFDPALMHGNDLELAEFEVYRVEDCGGFLEKPWREIHWNSEGKYKELKEYVQSSRPLINSVEKARILLVGQVGSGKSSFFNSINSVFRGNVTGQAITGIAGTSLSTQFRTYNIKAGRGGKPLPVVLCDSMGLEEGVNAGLDVDDIPTILNGNVPDRYQFNPMVPLQSDDSAFYKSPELKDRIHCVVYIMDACKVKLLSPKLLEKLTAIRKKVNHIGVPQLVLLTKVDEACPLVNNDLTKVYYSHYIRKIMSEVSVCLGVPEASVLPVKNYSREVDLDLNMNILLLSALVHMMRFTDNYFDDVSEEGLEKGD
ncbi:interferon-induced protein 44-like [Hypomesus transpacificus]|uniref:interferon-induced protein 44-like n=1 Tax=Hypomesus transpacificus TaxID=137520 RepID=UPI001F07DFA0|nr:interferon-induced protein 44-like [Hypomesus transpacificus]XP_046907351.1 interferon-induced protein 44-like [Hypomesus transpacificus]